MTVTGRKMTITNKKVIELKSIATNKIARKRTKTLDTAEAVRAEMQRLYKESRVGDISVDQASKLINALSLIYRIVEGSNIEKRLKKLEATK